MSWPTEDMIEAAHIESQNYQRGGVDHALCQAIITAAAQEAASGMTYGPVSEDGHDHEPASCEPCDKVFSEGYKAGNAEHHKWGANPCIYCDLDPLHAARQVDITSPTVRRLWGALASILDYFTDEGHPGRPCVRTNWVHVERVEEWRDLLSATEKPLDGGDV